MKIQILVLTMVLMATVSHAHFTCPTFWHLFNGNCYRYYGERLTWADAEEWCHQHFTLGGIAHLASVHSFEENAFLYELFRSSAGDTDNWVYDFNNRHDVYGVWIGMHQEVSNGPWVYTDGTNTEDYTNWKTNEPNNSYYQGEEEEDCVHIWRRNDADDTLQIWNDMYCGETMSFICQMPAPDA